VHSPGSEPTHWLRDSYAGPSLIVTAAANAGFTAVAALADIQAGTIRGLQIVFDEGNDTGTGFVFLDNITVELNSMPHVWRSPADNGNN
jgi:hypothetical protein